MILRGFFVVLEGPEGSGKSTLAAGLASRARAAGLDPTVVRDPGTTRAAEIARQALLDPEHPVGPLAELFFYLAARAELVEKVIRPALEEGRLVISDRYALSTEAYQIAGRGLSPDIVQPPSHAAMAGVYPDLTLVLDLPTGEGRARQLTAGKTLDRLDAESEEFHARVGAAYLAAQGEGVRHLDGRQAPDRLLQAAWSELLASAPELFGAAPV